ncbi:helix-turn-helix domain-containing protein [Coprococcus eutactus]|uniref:helix-turn-helix domain-containing protein n=1 Tax=Coprococcus eutactus TaxID=33043 RepID=UPI00321C0411
MEDVQKIFNIGRKKAIELMNSDGFPVIRFGRIYRVDSVELEHWIEQHRGETLT